MQDRGTFDEERLSGLEEIVMDPELAASILKASRTSMGMDASPVDMTNIVSFCERMVKLSEYRRDLYTYLVDKVCADRPLGDIALHSNPWIVSRTDFWNIHRTSHHTAVVQWSSPYRSNKLPLISRWFFGEGYVNTVKMLS